MEQTRLQLTPADRRFLEAFRRKGIHSAREITRAHLLLALDEGMAESVITQLLGISRPCLWSTRAAYLKAGLAYALHDLPRPGQPRKYQTEQEARIVALVCSDPPAGRTRWTIELLTQAAGEQVAGINRETVRQMLKKTR
jgi:transposase